MDDSTIPPSRFPLHHQHQHHHHGGVGHGCGVNKALSQLSSLLACRSTYLLLLSLICTSCMNVCMRRLFCWLFTAAPEEYARRSVTVNNRRNGCGPTTASLSISNACRPFVSHGYPRYLASSSSSSSLSYDATETLSERLNEAFREGQTDGVRDYLGDASSVSFLADGGLTAQQLVTSCLEASNGQKGQTISILNAILGSCVEAKDASKGAQMALDLVNVVEKDLDNNNNNKIKPDMLSYALAYAAVERHDTEQAAFLLQKAAHLSKKLAGSSRRKALAAARRKVIRRATDSVDELQALLGSYDFAVLEETDDYLVINKPPGTVVNHVHTTTSGKIGKRNADVSLVDALLHVNVPLSTLNPQALGLVHRLDRGTSGSIVLAKTDEMHARLVTEFFLRRVHKVYHTIVTPVPMETQGVLELPVHDRPARSNFSVTKKRGQDLAMVEMKTFTGRKHQVRVHAASGLQSPVLLDSLYGKDTVIPEDVEALLDSVDTTREKFFLHAAMLDIPAFGLSVSARKPSFWYPVLNLFENVEA